MRLFESIFELAKRGKKVEGNIYNNIKIVNNTDNKNTKSGANLRWKKGEEELQSIKEKLRKLLKIKSNE